MNNQETFDQVCAHLRRQGKKAQVVINDVVCCRFLTNDGCRCAVGCLIPPDQYKPEMENLGLQYLCQRVPALQGLDINLLTALQGIHDIDPIADWEKRLAQTAHFFNLYYTPPQRLDNYNG